MPQLFSLNEEDKAFCIFLARKSIEHYFEYNTYLEKVLDVPKKLEENKACFVTLTINNQLRGCIGHLTAIKPLYKDIIENSVSAAFNDPRFPPLTKEEFQGTKIEVSILTDPTPLLYKNTKDLLDKIEKGKHGLIIKKGYNSATFLPSVWEQISTKEEFLSHLCMKAGLSQNEWKNNSLEVSTYESIKAKDDSK